MKERRNASIDALVHSLIRMKCPTITNLSIQRRSKMELYSGKYTVLFDSRALVTIKLTSDNKFTTNPLTHQPIK